MPIIGLPRHPVAAWHVAQGGVVAVPAKKIRLPRAASALSVTESGRIDRYP